MDRWVVSRRAFFRRAAVAGAGLAARSIPAFSLLPIVGPGEAPWWEGRGADGARPGLRPPSVVTRAEWGADESLRTSARRFDTVRGIVVHHTANPWTGDSGADLRTVYRQHLKREDGIWGDIGYHFLIDPEGTVYEGRWARDYEPGEAHDGHDQDGRLVHGVHAQGFNYGTAGIALMGDHRSVKPSVPALASLVGLVAWLCDRHGLDPLADRAHVDASGTWWPQATIVGHRSVSDTVCPGRMAFDILPDLRQWVADRLEDGPSS